MGCYIRKEPFERTFELLRSGELRGRRETFRPVRRSTGRRQRDRVAAPSRKAPPMSVRLSLSSLVSGLLSAPLPVRLRLRSALLLLSAAESAAADVIAETPDGVAWLRSEWLQTVAERKAAETAAAERKAAAAAAEWAALPFGQRLSGVSPAVRALPLSGLGRYVPAYFEASEPGTSRTSAVPSLGTDDVDSVIAERLDVVSESETVAADGTVTAVAVVRLWTGSVNYGTASGSAVGCLEETDRLRTAARKAAERQARQQRSEYRAADVVLGTDGPGVPALLPDGSAPDVVCPVSGSEYRRLRGMVQRRAFGNASRTVGSRSGSAHVRAGVTASGVPVTPETVADGTSAAVLILCRWAVDGLPESLSETVAEWAETGQDVSGLLLGSAARDGLRHVTGAARPTALAAARSRWAARVAADPRADVTAPTSDRSNVVRRAANVSAGGSAYVGAGVSERLSAAVLQRTASGSLAFPTLAALLLLDSGEERGTGGVAAVARLLLGSSSGAARRTVSARLRSEWADVTAYRLPETADDSADAVRSGAVAFVR